MKPRRSGASSGPPSKLEWLGGARLAPFLVHDRPEPYRPGLALWFELPEGWVVGQAVQDPEESEGAALARALEEAMAATAIGQPRRPDSIRVADAAAAAVVRTEAAGDIPVTVAPTPELDRLFADLFEAMSDFDEGGVEASYLWDGRMPASAVASLFDAGRRLFALQPWTLADEPPPLRMDIPHLDVDGACVFVIGQTGDSRGVLMFLSLDDFDEFLLAAEEEGYKEGWVGSEVLSLTFESAAELPQGMRREATDHGWRVEGPDAYPVLHHVDPDGLQWPPTERDMEIATACAEALAALLQQHGGILSAPPLDPIRQSYFNRNDRKVRFTVPYENPELLDLDDPEDDEFDDREPFPDAGPFKPRAGRNEPCPCGSGRKYKKCHLRSDEARHAEGQRANLAHERDLQLSLRLAGFAAEEVGDGWEARLEQIFENKDPDSTFFALSLAVHSADANGETLMEAYLGAHASECSPDERRWLNAQQRAWFSVWEVESVEPGRSVSLRDLLSGERRVALERSASAGLARRDALLARVVDQGDMSLLATIHQHALPPLASDDIVARAREHLGCEGDVPIDRLQDGAFSHALAQWWREAIDEFRQRYAQPRELRNTDDHRLLPTVDRFDVEPARAAEIGRLILELDGAREEAGEGNAAIYAILHQHDTQPAGRRTLIGAIRVEGNVMRVETNSEERADTLRQRIEAVCGTRIRHRDREHRDLSDLGTHPAGPAAAPSEEQERLAAEHKARHYAEWPDIPLPALNDRTPCECARTAEGRREVDRLLKHMQNMEHRAAVGEPFDFSIIRDELGIRPR